MNLFCPSVEKIDYSSRIIHTDPLWHRPDALLSSQTVSASWRPRQICVDQLKENVSLPLFRELFIRRWNLSKSESAQFKHLRKIFIYPECLILRRGRTSYPSYETFTLSSPFCFLIVSIVIIPFCFCPVFPRFSFFPKVRIIAWFYFPAGVFDPQRINVGNEPETKSRRRDSFSSSPELPVKDCPSRFSLEYKLNPYIVKLLIACSIPWKISSDSPLLFEPDLSPLERSGNDPASTRLRDFDHSFAYVA